MFFHLDENIRTCHIVPGIASALSSLAGAGADLQVVMAYRYPGENPGLLLNCYPVTAKKSVAAAQEAGLSAATLPALLVEGDNRPGLGHAISQTMADAGINMDFVVAQVSVENIQLYLDST